MSEQDLIDIARDEGLQNGERINIHYVEVAEDVPQVEPQFIVVNTYPTHLTKVGSEWKAQSYFVISVARGQTTTLCHYPRFTALHNAACISMML